MTVIARFEPRGAARDLFTCRDREVLLSGPAGTGKSRACLEKLHLCASLARYAGMRGLMVRKTMVSLTATGLVTYKSKVLSPLDGVTFFGGSKDEPPAYRYPNGSRLLLGGLDDSQKIMSSEYDMIYVQEATELGLGDWENLTSRLRNGVMPYQQLIADCNPGPPTHWLKVRCDAGATTMLESRHEDNPRYYDAATGLWTTDGLAYLATLDALTGARKARLRFGRWEGAEGVVYEAWDERLHVIPRADLPHLRYYIASMDWGWTNPGVLQIWGVDGDGRMYLVREHYRVQQSITWWARLAKEERDRYQLRTVQCDPSEPGFIAEYRRAGVPAAPAFNGIQLGIQAVQARLQPAGDGRPRLYVVEDALAERDALIAEDQPSSLLTERPRYVWAAGADGKPNKEQPVDAFNHAQDAERYACAYLDHLGDKRPMEAAAGAKRADW